MITFICDVVINGKKLEVDVSFSYDLEEGEFTGKRCKECGEMLIKSLYKKSDIEIEEIHDSGDSYVVYTKNLHIRAQVLEEIVQHISFEGCSNKSCSSFAKSSYDEDVETTIEYHRMEQEDDHIANPISDPIFMRHDSSA